MSRGKFWKVSKRLWANPTFRQLTHLQKLIALYCLTEQTNRIGIFLFSAAKAAEDLSIANRAFESAFLVVCRAFGWKVDAKARVLWLPGWWRHNAPDNKDALRAYLNDVLEVPATPLLEEFFSNTDDLAEPLRQVFQDTVVTLAVRPSMTPCPPECPTPSDHGVDQGGGHTRLKTRLRQDKTETRLFCDAPAALREQFEQEFWNLYPMRNGRKLGKDLAFTKWMRLSEADKALIAIAVKNLAADVSKHKTLVKDAHRFIENGWREWLEPAATTGGIQHENLNGKNYRDGLDG